jgi:hypothetical protein
MMMTAGVRLASTFNGLVQLVVVVVLDAIAP